MDQNLPNIEVINSMIDALQKNIEELKDLRKKSDKKLISHGDIFVMSGETGCVRLCAKCTAPSSKAGCRAFAAQHVKRELVIK